jgi:isopentenyl phosphate kinase
MLKFLKLGGSLITDKNAEEAARESVIRRAAAEIAEGLAASPDTQLLVGHGSGSFGHVAANRYKTRSGVSGSEAWHGFADVSVVAARLNHLVTEALHEAGIPVMRIQPSATAVCTERKITAFEIEPIRRALDAGLVPVVYGDVAFDREIGGTIISTEEIFFFLAEHLKPASIWLAGEVPGVLDRSESVVERITPDTIDALRSALGGSAGTDVTGGMISKVGIMLDLCERVPGLSVHIFSGAEEGYIRQAVAGQPAFGTTIQSGQ